MPAERALTEARKGVGQGHGNDGGANSFRARLEESAAFLAPLALIVGLALAGGGFDLSSRHIAGLAVWLGVVCLLALGAAGRAVLGRPFYWTSGLLGAVALFSALSSLWSGSIELSVTEFDRVLVYLGVFIAAFLIVQTDQRRQRFAEGLAIGLIAIALLGLASRLIPHVLSVSGGLGTGARLRYPLEYWNANGIAFALAAVLILWLSRRSLIPALRWVAVATLPAVLLAIYFTYSRGGILALVIGCGLVIVLSHDRIWLLGTLAIGALGALPAVLAVQARSDLYDNLDTAAAVDQGLTVLLILLAGTALSLALSAALRRLERREGAVTGRAVAVSRDRRVLIGVGLVLALAAIVAAIAVGGRAWDQFTTSDLTTVSPQERLNDFSGAGRSEFWRVALDAFGEDPVAGHGAGTYQFSWNQLREIPKPVTQAHSLYLQSFAELGLVGGLLVLAVVLTMLWTGFAAWRHARGSQRELFAALLAVAVTFAVGAAIDWFWEIATVGAVFFLSSGVLVAGRCAQLNRARVAAEGRSRDQQRRFGLTVAGLALAWVAALALVGPLLVDRELDSSRAAAAGGDYASAVSHADTARSIEPWAASPYLQLGLLAQVQNDFPVAVSRIGEAIDREDRNWVLYYLRAKIEDEAGESAAAKADLAEAQRLNPEEACLDEGFEGCG